MPSIRNHAITAVLALLSVLVSTQTASGQPEVFEDITVKDAIERTSGSARVLVVKATAVWCGPCKRMDATTWVDESVVSWIREYGLATQFDVDEQPELARELRVRAMPTMIAFRDGEEFDRIVGYRDANGLLAWMNDVKAGKTGLDRAREAAADGADDGERIDIRARMELARSLHFRGKYEEATDEFLWLWDNMLDHQPSMVGVRLSYMVSDMKNLAEEHEPSKERFIAARNGLTARLQDSERRSWSDLQDWIALNRVVSDAQATLDWFDRVKARPDGPPTLRRMSHTLDELLMKHERYTDLEHIGWDPVADLRRSLEMSGFGMDDWGEARREEMLTSSERFAASRAGGALFACIKGDHIEHVEPLVELLNQRISRVDGVVVAYEHLLRRGVAHSSLLPPLDRAIESESAPQRKRTLRDLRKRVRSSLEH